MHLVFIFCNVLAIATLQGTNAAVVDPFNTLDSSTVDSACHSRKWVVSHAVLRSVVGYFGNKQAKGSTFDPNNIKPFTPTGIFAAYYGEEASAVKFSAAILDLLPKSITNRKIHDRFIMRRDLYKFIKAHSFKYARTKASHLIKDIIEDFVPYSTERCLNYTTSFQIQNALQVELFKIRNEVGDVLFGRFLELDVGSSLTFVIDTTGSMSAEINAAKSRAKEIVNLRKGSLDAPNDFVLVPFNDPKVGPYTKTANADEFNEALSRLGANGGGDLEEMCLGGIQLAIEHSSPGSVLYVITDAGAKDFQLQDSVIAEAKRKFVQVTFMVTSANLHCDNIAGDEYLQCAELYQHVAQTTGGKYIVVERSAIFDATKIVERSVQQSIVRIANYQSQPNSKLCKHGHVDDNLLMFPISPLESNITMEFFECGDSVPTFSFDNSTSYSLDLTRIGDSVFHTIPAIEKARGHGIATLFASHCKEVSISARSTVDFIMNMFHRKSNDDKWKPLESQPTIGSDIRIEITGVGISDNIFVDEIVITMVDDSVFRTFPVKRQQIFGKTPIIVDWKSEFFEHCTPEFYVKVKGKYKTEEKEYDFVRVLPQKIAFTTIEIFADFSQLYFRPDEGPTKSNITIFNRGKETEEFLITTSDPESLSFFDIVSFRYKTKKIVIEGEKNVTHEIVFKTSKKLADGKSTLITISAVGQKSKKFQYMSSYIVVSEKLKPKITSLDIEATINARLAETVITSKMFNHMNEGREAELDVLLPTDAFITELIMITEDDTIVGKIEEKKKAEKIYTAAKQHGFGAGHVAAKDDSTRAFRQSSFVKPGKNITFILKYQQLLKRVNNEYEYAVVLNPRQPVRRMVVSVHIVEQSPLGFVRVPSILTEQSYAIKENETPEMVTITHGRHGKTASVIYQPTMTLQRQYSPLGISGKFRVKYDVRRDSMHGQLAAHNGYFAHFFAPPNIPPPPKLVVFAIDNSGSMYGQKLSQVKEAMQDVLNGLRSGDRFNIVTFGSKAVPWLSDVLAWGTSGSILDAKRFVNNAVPLGGTNLFDAMNLSISLLEPFLPPLPVPVGSGSGAIFENESESETTTTTLVGQLNKMPSDLENYAKMIVLLTDGKPSEGLTEASEIVNELTNSNQGRFNIHTLGFGSQADMDLLDKIAVKNSGTSRRIFEGLDATAQIKNYLNEVTTPILKDVVINYPEEKVKDLTTNTFSVFLAGSELVVAGRVDMDKEISFEEDLLDSTSDSKPNSIHTQVLGSAFENSFDIEFDFPIDKPSPIIDVPQHIENFTERLWAFLKVQQLLRNSKLDENKVSANLIKEEALNMSLKYSFVTPLTSIVVLSEKERKIIEEELSKTTTTALPSTTSAKFPPYPYRSHDKEYLDGEYGYYDSMETGHLTPIMEASYEVAEPPLEPIRDYDSYLVTDDEDILADHYKKIYTSRIERIKELPTFPAKHVRLDSPAVERSRSGGGGFSGDPHFVINVNEESTICFNWDGDDGDIYSLIREPVRGFEINGKLKNSLNKGSEKRTFMSDIALVHQPSKLSCLITPYNITLIHPRTENISLPLEKGINVQHGGIIITVEQVFRRTAVVLLEIDDLFFNATLYRNRVSMKNPDHIDLGILNNIGDLSVQSGGVIGQFAKFSHDQEFNIRLQRNSKDGYIKTGKKTVATSKHQFANPNTHEPVTCWYLTHGAYELTGKNKNDFIINKILRTQPAFSRN